MVTIVLPATFLDPSMVTLLFCQYISLFYLFLNPNPDKPPCAFSPLDDGGCLNIDDTLKSASIRLSVLAATSSSLYPPQDICPRYQHAPRRQHGLRSPKAGSFSTLSRQAIHWISTLFLACPCARIHLDIHRDVCVFSSANVHSTTLYD